MSLVNDEKLAVEVQKYLCLIDKSLACYKESRPKRNAWKLIDDSLEKDLGSSQQTWNFVEPLQQKKIQAKES